MLKSFPLIIYISQREIKGDMSLRKLSCAVITIVSYQTMQSLVNI